MQERSYEASVCVECMFVTFEMLTYCYTDYGVVWRSEAHLQPGMNEMWMLYCGNVFIVVLLKRVM